MEAVPPGMKRIGRVLYSLQGEANKRPRSYLERVMVAIKLYMVMRMLSMKESLSTRAFIEIRNQCPSLKCFQSITVRLSVHRESFMVNVLLFVAIIVFSKKI